MNSRKPQLSETSPYVTTYASSYRTLGNSNGLFNVNKTGANHGIYSPSSWEQNKSSSISGKTRGSDKTSYYASNNDKDKYGTSSILFGGNAGTSSVGIDNSNSYAPSYRSSFSTLNTNNKPVASYGSFGTNPSTVTASRNPPSGPDVLPNGSIGHSGSGYMSFRDIFNQIAQINDHLYLCSLSAIDSSRLRQLGITLIVSAIVEQPPSYAGALSVEVMHIPVEDMEHANIRIYFDRVSDRIHAEHMRGGRVLVHCMAGISRSTSLVLAYLIKHQKMSLREAFTHVRSRRSCVQPNLGFWRQLLDFEERINGSRTVKLINSGGGTVYPDVLGRPTITNNGSGGGSLFSGRNSGLGNVSGSPNRRSNFGTFVSRLQLG